MLHVNHYLKTWYRRCTLQIWENSWNVHVEFKAYLIFFSWVRIKPKSSLNGWLRIAREWFLMDLYHTIYQPKFDCSCLLRVVVCCLLQVMIWYTGFCNVFFGIKFDKYTMETCFHNGNVRFFSFFLWNWSVHITLPLNSGTRTTCFY